MNIEPIALSIKDGFTALGVGTTKGYELINAGEVETFYIGRARRITTASIKAYVARQIALQAEAA